jgi:hypothetical protein
VSGGAEGEGEGLGGGSEGDQEGQQGAVSGGCQHAMQAVEVPTPTSPLEPNQPQHGQ